MDRPCVQLFSDYRDTGRNSVLSMGLLQALKGAYGKRQAIEKQEGVSCEGHSYLSACFSAFLIQTCPQDQGHPPQKVNLGMPLVETGGDSDQPGPQPLPLKLIRSNKTQEAYADDPGKYIDAIILNIITLILIDVENIMVRNNLNYSIIE